MRLSGKQGKNSLNTNPVPPGSTLSGVGDSSESLHPNVVPAGSSLSLANKLAGISDPSAGGVSVHSDLQGLSANDHPQYLLSSLASSITGGVSVHSALAGLTNDDHPQYLLSSLSSNFIGTNYTTHLHSQYLTTAALSSHEHTDYLLTGYTTHTHSQYQSTGNYLTTAALSNHSHGNPTLNLTNLSGTTASASNGLTLSLSAVPAINTSQSSLFQHTSATSAITANAFPTANTTNLAVSSVASRVVQINGSSGNISFATGSSLSSSQNGSTVTWGLASNITTALQSAGAYLTTAAVSNHSHAFSASGGSSNFQTLNFANSNGLTFTNTNGSVALAHGLQYTSNTSDITSNAINTSQSSLFQHTSATSAITSNALNTSVSTRFAGTGTTFNGANVAGSLTLNSNGLQISLSAADPGGGGGPTIEGSGTYSQNTGTVKFQNSNSVTFGLSNNGVMTASIPNFNTANVGLNTARTNVTWTVNSSGISINAAGYAGTLSTFAGTNISGSITLDSVGLNLALSAGNYLTTAALSNHSHGNPTLALTNLSGTTASASNGLTLSLSAAAPGAGGGVAIAGSNTTYTSGTVIMSGQNMTIATSVNGASQYIRFSAPTNGGNLYYNDSNGVSWGSSVNGVSTTVTASVNAGGGVALRGSGTYTQNTGTVQFANSNGVTFGLSNNGVMTASVNAGGAVQTLNRWSNFTGISSHQAPGQNSIWFVPFELSNPVSASSLQIGMTFTGTATSAATAQFGMTQDFAIYSKHPTNSTRYDSHWSTRHGFTLWNSGTSSASWSSNGTGSNSAGSNIIITQVYGQRIISAVLGSELSTGDWMFAYRQSTSSANYSALVRSFNPVFVTPIPIAKNFIGSQTATSVGHFLGGVYSASSSEFPSSIGTGDLRKSNDWQMFFMLGNHS